MWNKVPKNEYHKGKPGKKQNPFKKDVIVYDQKSMMGYRDDSPYRQLPVIDINTPNGYIDMSATGIPLFANGQYLPPYSGQHFMGTDVVREIPINNWDDPSLDVHLVHPHYKPLPQGEDIDPGFSPKTFPSQKPTGYYNPQHPEYFQQGGWLDAYQQGGDPSIPELNQAKKGGSKGHSKKTGLKVNREFTSKNIQSSINDLMLRNETLYGPAGKKRYKPDLKYQQGGSIFNHELLHNGTEAVQRYQKMLNDKYNAGLAEDGIWGKHTQTAYEQFILNKDISIKSDVTKSIKSNTPKTLSKSNNSTSQKNITTPLKANSTQLKNQSEPQVKPKPQTQSPQFNEVPKQAASLYSYNYNKETLNNISISATKSKQKIIPSFAENPKQPQSQFSYDYNKENIDKTSNQSQLPNDVIEVINEKKKDSNWANFPGNYFIYSKENSTFYILNNNHEVIDSVISGRGRTPGNVRTSSNSSITPSGAAVISQVATDPATVEHFGAPFARIKWVDNYNDHGSEGSAEGIHGVYPKEFDIRTAILNNPQVTDKLFSYGCINVPKEFLAQHPVQVGDSLFVTPEPNRPLTMPNIPRKKYGGWLDNYQGGGTPIHYTSEAEYQKGLLNKNKSAQQLAAEREWAGKKVAKAEAAKKAATPPPAYSWSGSDMMSQATPVQPQVAMTYSDAPHHDIVTESKTIKAKNEAIKAKNEEDYKTQTDLYGPVLGAIRYYANKADDYSEGTGPTYYYKDPNTNQATAFKGASAYEQFGKYMPDVAYSAFPLGEIVDPIISPVGRYLKGAFTFAPELSGAVDEAAINSGYKFPKYPLQSAETQVGIDPVHYRAVDAVQNNSGSYYNFSTETFEPNIKKSYLVNPQFGHDYVLPEGMGIDELNEFARRNQAGLIKPSELNDVYESLVKLNPELKNININKTDLIHGVASHIAPQDLVNLKSTPVMGAVDPSKGFLENFKKGYQEAKWNQFTNENEGFDFRFSPERQKEIMKTYKPLNTPMKKQGGWLDNYQGGGAPIHYKTQAEYQAHLLDPYSPEKKAAQAEWLAKQSQAQKPAPKNYIQESVANTNAAIGTPGTTNVVQPGVRYKAQQAQQFQGAVSKLMNQNTKLTKQQAENLVSDQLIREQARQHVRALYGPNGTNPKALYDEEAEINAYLGGMQRQRDKEKEMLTLGTGLVGAAVAAPAVVEAVGSGIAAAPEAASTAWQAVSPYVSAAGNALETPIFNTPGLTPNNIMTYMGYYGGLKHAYNTSLPLVEQAVQTGNFEDIAAATGSLGLDALTFYNPWKKGFTDLTTGPKPISPGLAHDAEALGLYQTRKYVTGKLLRDPIKNEIKVLAGQPTIAPTAVSAPKEPTFHYYTGPDVPYTYYTSSPESTGIYQNPIYTQNVIAPESTGVYQQPYWLDKYR